MTNTTQRRESWFGLTVPEGETPSWQQATRWKEQEAEKSHLLSKPVPSDRFPPARLLYLTSPNSATNWIPKVQMPKPVGDIVIKPSQRSSTEGFQHL